MNNEFEKSDLETVDYYFLVCSECKKATRELQDWPDAIAYAKTRGYQIEDGVVYCKYCVALELQRQEEESEVSA